MIKINVNMVLHVISILLMIMILFDRCNNPNQVVSEKHTKEYIKGDRDTTIEKEFVVVRDSIPYPVYVASADSSQDNCPPCDSFRVYENYAEDSLGNMAIVRDSVHGKLLGQTIILQGVRQTITGVDTLKETSEVVLKERKYGVAIGMDVMFPANGNPYSDLQFFPGVTISNDRATYSIGRDFINKQTFVGFSYSIF
jgi:hypothetical protein